MAIPCMLVSAIALVSDMVVVGVVVGVVSSAFLPQLTAASAMVSDRSATITRANVFRIFSPSPPLDLAASGSSAAAPELT